jgi:ABC-type Fe3+/spermidine/putrescine transport system ATPase subunit
VGTPQDLFFGPIDAEVARFFGGCNFFQGTLIDGKLHSRFGQFPASGFSANGHPLTATIRPEHVNISLDASCGLPGTVTRTLFEGSATRIWVDCNGARLVALAPDSQYQSGQPVFVRLPSDKIHIFAP